MGEDLGICRDRKMQYQRSEIWKKSPLLKAVVTCLLHTDQGIRETTRGTVVTVAHGIIKSVECL